MHELCSKFTAKSPGKAEPHWSVLPPCRSCQHAREVTGFCAQGLNMNLPQIERLQAGLMSGTRSTPITHEQWVEIVSNDNS